MSKAIKCKCVATRVMADGSLRHIPDSSLGYTKKNACLIHGWDGYPVNDKHELIVEDVHK